MLDANGVPLGIAGINIDITACKETEEGAAPQQIQARARFRELKALYQNAPVGLALLDRTALRLGINAALADINGLPVKDHVGRYLFDALPALRDVADSAPAGHGNRRAGG